jgi:hypothetical protein
MNKDVIIACYRMIDLKLNINEPFAICRQSINDFFASTLYPDKDIVGVSVTRDNCPAEIDYRLMVAANTVFKQDMIHIYYEDTIDDILKCATHLKVYNRTLNNLQESYINSMGLLNRNNKASIALGKKYGFVEDDPNKHGHNWKEDWSSEYATMYRPIKR